MAPCGSGRMVNDTLRADEALARMLSQEEEQAAVAQAGAIRALDSLLQATQSIKWKC